MDNIYLNDLLAYSILVYIKKGYKGRRLSRIDSHFYLFLLAENLI